MCLAVVVTKGFKLPKENAEAGFLRNTQGAGFAYIDNNKVEIKKGYFDFDEFWQDYEVVQESFEGPFLVHFRIATCGGVNAFNCHPWQINEQSALIHNGMFFEFSTEPGISDTGIYTSKIIRPLFDAIPNFTSLDAFTWLMDETINGNKVAILSADGSFGIYARSKWIEKDGVLYSNSSYIPHAQTLYPHHHSHYSHDSSHTSRKHYKHHRAWDNYANDCGFGRGPIRKKNPKYRMKGETNIMSVQQINLLTHKVGMKIKEMVSLDLVEKVYLDERNNIINKKDSDYKDFWLNKEPNSPIDTFRDEISKEEHYDLPNQFI